jgi:molecular chaperone GrpE (heat shock protein)
MMADRMEGRVEHLSQVLADRRDQVNRLQRENAALKRQLQERDDKLDDFERQKVSLCADFARLADLFERAAEGRGDDV